MSEVWYLKQLRKYEREIKDLRKEKERLEKALEEEKRRRKEAEEETERVRKAKEARRPKFPDYSLGRQERIKDHERGKSTGRRSKSEKLKEVDREEDIYPEGVLPVDCILETTRVVTRLTDGRKEVVLYRMYRKKWSVKKGILPDVLPRSEYGFEVVIAVAFLIQCLGLSFGQARNVLSFFCGLDLEKPEIDCLLSQLSREWKKEMEAISELILLSFVVYMDETGWKVGKKNCYTWIFTTALHTVLLYGQSRKEEVLDRILPRDRFKGVGISDCLRIYEKRFGRAQKCWAHFLRKAIKLMLLHPEDDRYKTFFEDLFDIFVSAKQEAERQEKKRNQGASSSEEEAVIGTALQKQVKDLCTESEIKLNKKVEKDFREFVNLQKNLVRNIDDLFTFVFVTGADPTNNKAERGFRHTARERNNYQTSKSEYGAERKTIIASVFTSLRQNLSDFTLQSIIEEVTLWRIDGQSLFQRQLAGIRNGASP